MTVELTPITPATGEPTLSVAYNDLRTQVGFELGYGLSDWDDDQAAKIALAIQRGYRQFLTPAPIGGEKKTHAWSFLRQADSFTTSAPYSTGTIGVVNGVGTLTGGTNPTWLEDGDLVAGGNTYRISTRNSGTGFTLADLTVDIDAGTSYVFERYRYTLPDNYGGIDGPITYSPEATNRYPALRHVAEWNIRELRQTHQTNGRPIWFAVQAKAGTSGGQRFELHLGPTPDAEYRLDRVYRVLQNQLDGDNPYPLGGGDHSETIMASCLAIAELMLNDQRGPRWQAYQERLAASIEHDRKAHVPETLGYNGDPSVGAGAFHPRQYAPWTVSNNGVLPNGVQ